MMMNLHRVLPCYPGKWKRLPDMIRFGCLPGEQVSITSDNRMTVQKTDINVVVSWMDGKFGFSNERLDVIMRKICRWYDVEVLYAVPGIRERRFHRGACQ